MLISNQMQDKIWSELSQQSREYIYYYFIKCNRLKRAYSKVEGRLKTLEEIFGTDNIKSTFNQDLTNSKKQ